MHTPHKVFHSSYLTSFINLVAAGLLLLAQITFLPSQGRWLYTLTTKGMSVTWDLGSLSYYGLQIFATAAILWCLMAFTKRPLSVADSGHFWLLAFWTGIALAFTLIVLSMPY